MLNTLWCCGGNITLYLLRVSFSISLLNFPLRLSLLLLLLHHSPSPLLTLLLIYSELPPTSSLASQFPFFPYLFHGGTLNRIILNKSLLWNKSSAHTSNSAEKCARVNFEILLCDVAPRYKCYLSRTPPRKIFSSIVNLLRISLLYYENTTLLRAICDQIIIY